MKTNLRDFPRTRDVLSAIDASYERAPKAAASQHYKPLIESHSQLEVDLQAAVTVLRDLVHAMEYGNTEDEISARRSARSDARAFLVTQAPKGIIL